MANREDGIPQHRTGQGELEGKVALVTGGSRGLGREIAEAFAQQGATVIVASRKLDACERTAAEITALTGVEALPLAAHVGEWDECTELIGRSIALRGHLDILVNCAGIAPRYEHLHEVSEALFDKVMDVNLKGPFRLATLAAHEMVKAGGGSIVNISSIAAIRPSQFEVPYGAAKAGLHVLTYGMAQAYGPTVRTNTIMAGPFLTDMSASWDEDQRESLAELFPLRRLGSPHEIAGAAVYFAGPASSFTTGSVLCIDGGLSTARQAL